MQPESIKHLADKVLARNRERNRSATFAEKTVAWRGKKIPSKLHRVALEDPCRYRVFEYRREGLECWSVLISIRPDDTEGIVKHELERCLGCDVEVRLKRELDRHVDENRGK